jgi:hypothetical protein
MEGLILVRRYSNHDYRGQTLGVASEENIARAMEKDDFKDYLELGHISPDTEPRYTREILPPTDTRVPMF